VTPAGHVVSPPGLAAGIWPLTTRVEPAGETSVGGVVLGDLAARYGTPAYIVAEADVRHRCRAYREAFPGAEIAYAGKAFLCRAMIRWIEQEGLALDVCSAGELAVARSVSFPAKRILFYLVLSGLMIPFTVVLVPVVQLLADVGWINTYQGLIVPNLASALGCFLYRQFFLGAPAELGAAARIDGASEWRIFFTIYRPLAQPMTAALMIISFLQNWNNFLFPLVVTSSQNLMMVSQGLTVFQANINQVSYNLLMAGSLIAVVPVLAVAMVAQRRVVDGLTLGAVR